MAIINIRVFSVDILQEIPPDLYGTYFIMDRKGVKKISVQCQNVIYGKITSSLLYYKKFRKSLEDEGHEFNPYDLCVANNIIKVSQMNVCFHVDYCNLRHKIPKVVGKTIAWIKK